MKTNRIFMAAMAVMALMPSCKKENPVNDAFDGTFTLTLSASMDDAADTKASLGEKTGSTYPMYWQAEGETVAAVITDAEGKKTVVVSNESYTVSEDGKTADFGFEIDEELVQAAKSVKFISPANKVDESGNIDFSSLYIQKPVEAGKADPDMCIICSEDIQIEGSISLDSFSDVKFTPEVGFANMKLKNLGLNGELDVIKFFAEVGGSSLGMTIDFSGRGVTIEDEMNVVFAVNAGNGITLDKGFSVSVCNDSHDLVTKEVAAGTLAFAKGKVSEFAVRMPDQTYSLDASSVKFDESYVVNVNCGSKVVAQVCKEYIRTTDASCDKSKIVIYPVSDGKIDVTKGIDFETGGSVSWISGSKNDEVTFSSGNGEVSMLYFCNGEISLTTTSIDLKDASTSYEKFTDGSGNTYPIVKIGKVMWMAQNLYTKKYADGTSIKSRTSWTKINGAYRNWSDKSANSTDILYNGFTASDYETGNVAPKGWQVSSYNEWKRLSSYLSTAKGKKLLSADAGGNNITGLSIDGSGNYDGTNFQDNLDEIYYWTPDLKNTMTETHYAVKFTKGSDTFSYTQEKSPESGFGAYLRCTKEL